ncbi:MAG: phosphatidylserine/phosphatidylglycerophosphate/cardiolipin synthase family protein [Bacteroidota bacterium]
MTKQLQFLFIIIITINYHLLYCQSDSYANNDAEFNYNIKSSSNFNINPNNLENFGTDYYSLIQYYNSIDINYIRKGEVSFLDLDLNPIDIDINSIEFLVDSRDSTILLNKAVSPESAQNLFSLNEKQYVSTYGGNDFLSAKINSYKNLQFSTDKMRYSKKYLQFWDWKSLNHPPLRKLQYPLDFYDTNKKAIDYDTINSPFFNPDFHFILDKNTNTHLTFGNHLELLRNGYSYQKKLELIKSAKSSILISVMSYFNDESTTKMTEELIKKSKEGVIVYLIVEKVWTKLMMKKAMRKFKKSDVVIIYADDLLNIEKNQVALFHNKIFVFDGITAIVGGQNIIDSDNISSGYNHQSHDTDLLIEGPAVTDIALSIVELLERYSFEKKSIDQQIEYIRSYQGQIQNRLKLEKDQKLRGQENYKDILENKNTRLDGVCRFVIQGPQNDRFAVSKAFLYYFKHAQNSIDITTGKIKIDIDNKVLISNYEGWSKQVWTQLFKSAAEGIQINLIHNGIDGGNGEFTNYLKRKVLTEPDNKFITSYFPSMAERFDLKAAKRNYPVLYYLQEQKNINAWMYFQYMHSKTFLIDRFVVSVSSYNLDNWSSDKSQESGLICQDKELAKQFEYFYVLDKVNSTPVLLKN